MGTRISVSVAVVSCICRQNELAGRVIPSSGSATSDIRMPDAMHSVMDSSSSRLTSQTNRSRPPPPQQLPAGADHPVPVQREVDQQDHAEPDAEPFVSGDPGESQAVGQCVGHQQEGVKPQVEPGPGQNPSAAGGNRWIRPRGRWACVHGSTVPRRAWRAHRSRGRSTEPRSPHGLLLRTGGDPGAGVAGAFCRPPDGAALPDAQGTFPVRYPWRS